MRKVVIVTGVVLLVGFVGLIALGLLFLGFPMHTAQKTITTGDLVISNGNVKVLGVPSMPSSTPQNVSIVKKENGDTFVDMTYRSPSFTAHQTSLSSTVMHAPNNENIKTTMNILPFVLLLVITIFVIGAVLWKASCSRADAACSADEVRLMQDLHQGFMRMQERIASLETILIDRKREI